MHGMILQDAESDTLTSSQEQWRTMTYLPLCRSQHRWFSRRPEHQGDVTTTSVGARGWLNGSWVAIIGVVVLLQTPAAVKPLARRLQAATMCTP